MADQNSFGASSHAGKALKTEVVLLAVPLSVRAPTSGQTVDALGEAPDAMERDWKVVVFRIERVLKGKFETFKQEDPSLWSQMKEAAEDKNVLKLATMDFERPSEEPEEKNTFSMAVSDPVALFGMNEGDVPTRQRYKVSLAQVSTRPESYIMVKSEKA